MKFKLLEKAERIFRDWRNLAPKVLLSLVAFSLLVFLLQVMSGPLTFTQAADSSCLTASSDGGPDGRGTVATMGTATVTNTCKTAFTGTLFAGKAWCTGVAPDGHCGANLSWTTLITGTLGAGQTIMVPVNISQMIGNNGKCGSAQVDISVDKKTALSGHFAFGEPCSPPPPPAKHKECRSEACMVVNGAGKDKCSTDADCKIQTHMACQGEACMSVSGPGANQCSTNADCAPATHKVCQEQACKVVSGPGQNQCSVDDDCKTPTHKACQDQACMVVSGPGQNQCNIDNDCVTLTHIVCKGEACVSVSGPGQNQCSSDSDCKTPNHNVCQNEACVSVSGPGQNQCNADGDCKSPTHKECQSNACAVVSGPGRDRCSSDSDCVSSVQSAFCDNLTVSPQSGNTPLAVTAGLSGHTVSGGSIVGYKFDFGDGSGLSGEQSGNTMSHTYSIGSSVSTNTFVVNGFVVDNMGNIAGGSGGCQKVVAVSPVGVTPPPPPAGQVLGAIPRTGAETDLLVALLGSGAVGFAVKKYLLRKIT